MTLVNLRAGQDSGYFFVQPSVDALTYAGDHGIDVVNMSYFIDPWLFNCRQPGGLAGRAGGAADDHRGDARALDYAHLHGVTLIAAAGNEHTNLAQSPPTSISPDFPPGTEHTRTVDNNCLVMPARATT